MGKVIRADAKEINVGRARDEAISVGRGDFDHNAELEVGQGVANDVIKFVVRFVHNGVENVAYRENFFGGADHGQHKAHFNWLLRIVGGGLQGG